MKVAFKCGNTIPGPLLGSGIDASLIQSAGRRKPFVEAGKKLLKNRVTVAEAVEKPRKLSPKLFGRCALDFDYFLYNFSRSVTRGLKLVADAVEAHDQRLDIRPRPRHRLACDCGRI